MEPELIQLTEPDYSFVKEVYDNYILHSTATFHTEKISIAELKDAISIDHPDFHGKGLGKNILLKLEDVAADLGFAVLLGIITGENGSSIALFEKCGYEKCAHFKDVGEKFNRILDVVAYQKIIHKK